MFRSSDDHQGAFWSWLKSLVKMWVFKCVYASAYGHSFCVLYCAERHVRHVRHVRHASPHHTKCKSRPPPRFDPRTVQPVPPTRLRKKVIRLEAVTVVCIQIRVFWALTTCSFTGRDKLQLTLRTSTLNVEAALTLVTSKHKTII
jgi:hypothetical protein